MNPVAALLLTIMSGLGLTGPAVRSIAPGSVGYDVSYPQCGRTLPSGSAFGIVGVAGGKPYTTNPCLASEFAWANASPGGPAFYMNTANPGATTTVVNWYGQRSPDPTCAVGREAACAYNFGYNAAASAMAYAQAQTGQATNAMWWLDVETANSWSRTDLAANLASIRGSIAFLERQPGVKIGIYSIRQMWTKITGGASVILPNWVAGAANLAEARERCAPAWSATGGPVVLTQFVDRFDANYAC